MSGLGKWLIENYRKCERWTVAFVAVAVTLYILVFDSVGTSGDTPSYINAWKSISSGHIDLIRTPVYPCLIGLCKAIAGGNGMLLMVFVIQNIVACIASWYFYKLALRVLHSDTVAFISALILICLPLFTLFRSYILTESLSISGLVFLVYCAIRLYDGGSKANIIGVAFWLFFLIFMRPSFLYLLPVLLVAFVLMAIKKRGLRLNAVLGIVVVALVSASTLAYMSAFKRSYGVFTCTRVGIINDLCMMNFDGSLDPDKSPSPQLAKNITYIYDTYGRGPSYDKMTSKALEQDFDSLVLYSWDLPTLSATVHGSKTLKNQLQGVLIRCHYLMGAEVRDGKPALVVFFNYAIICGFLTVLVYALFIVVYIFRYRELPWISFLLLMLGVSNIIVTVVGAQAEWPRLVYPSKFIYLLMNIQILLIVIGKLSKKHYKVK